MQDKNKERAEEESLFDPTELSRRGVLAGTVGLAFLPKYQSAAASGEPDGNPSKHSTASEESDGNSPEHSNAPIDIGSRLELFVDDYLIEEVDGIRSNYHHPEPEEVVVEHDEPWEGGSSIYHSLFQDDDHYYDYRMYYRGSGFESGGDVAYIESDDGIDWERPNLTEDNTNIVTDLSSIQHNAAVFKDGNPDAPEDERYKAIGTGGGGLSAFVSPDGFDWSPVEENPVITDGAFDSQNVATWDPINEEYRAYWRYFDDGRRAIRTARSDDYREWTDQKNLSYPEAPSEQLYTNGIKPYYRAPHIWLGFPARYVERDPDSQSMRELPGWDLREGLLPSRSGYALTDTLFMSSRDGETFSRAPEAFIKPGLWEDDARNNWFYGDNYPTWQLVEIDSPDPERPEELSLYATEKYRTGQNEPGNGASQLRRFSLRVDGFVSMHAPITGGEFVTKPIKFDGRQLVVNYSTSAGGSIRVELQNPGGQPYQGFSLDESPELFGDDLERAVEWQGDRELEDLRDEDGEYPPVRLRFVMADADLYSFQFGTEFVGSPEDLDPTVHYPMDDIGAGGIVEDSSSNENHATNDGATEAQGVVDGAFEFGGGGVDTPSLPFNSGEATVATWVNADNLENSQMLFTGAGEQQLVLYLFGDQPTWWIGTEDGNTLVRDPSINAGEWVHLAGTFDGTTLNLYVDGDQVASEDVGSSAVLDPGMCRLGSNLSKANPLQGRLDDVWAFDSALSANEIQVLANRDTAQETPATAPIAHYALDTISEDPDRVIDASSNGYDGTSDGAAVADGLIDDAYAFDGAAGVDTPSLPFDDGEISVAGWINPDELGGSQYLFHGAGDHQIVLYVHNGQPTVWINTEDGPELARDPSISTGEWVHVAGTFDGSVLRLYLDGDLADQTEVSSNVLLDPGSCRVGSHLDGSNGFPGRIDDLWVFDEALSEAEIQAIVDRA